ncbi:hypothetical protein ARTHRO9V_140062 [Arthrobacter sp. 9V]|nr:hypothetical protein ARTHRO9V_140062 [Arthrobacter sp. 9V]
MVIGKKIVVAAWGAVEQAAGYKRPAAQLRRPAKFLP